MGSVRFLEFTRPHIRWSAGFILVGGAGGLALFGKFILPWAPFSSLPAVSAVGTFLLCTAIAMAYVSWRTEVRIEGTAVTVLRRPLGRRGEHFDISAIQKLTPEHAPEEDPRRTVVEVGLDDGRTVRLPTRRADALLAALRPPA